MHITRRFLVSARQGDQAPGVEISDPACPIGWGDLDGAAKRWAAEGGYGSDASELLYVVTDNQGGAGLPIGFEAHRLPPETSGLDGAFIAPVEEEGAAFLTDPHHPLAINGLHPGLAEEGRVHLPASAVEFLIHDCSWEEDGFIQVIDGDPVIWIRGMCTELIPA